MFLKVLIIFIAGVIETFLFTGWNLAVNKKQIYLSTILMLSYMLTYLLILDAAFKDQNSIIMIVSYTVACGVGNFIRVYREKNHAKN